MKQISLSTLSCLLIILGTCPVKPQQLATTKMATRSFKPEVHASRAVKEQQKQTEQLRRRIDVLKMYLQTVSPDSKDYQVTESSIRTLSAKLVSLTSDELQPPEATPEETQKVEGQFKYLSGTGGGIATPDGQKGGGQPSSPSGGGGGGSLPGLSYERTVWESKLTLPNIPSSKRAVACYRLAYTNSATQPLILEPTKIRRSCSVETDKAGKDYCEAHPDQQEWSPCSPLDAKHPLLMQQVLVIGIDASEIETNRLRLLNINVTNQQGSPINPTPIRPSFSSSAASAVNLGGGIYYLTWPNELSGDTIPTVSVNTIYTPPLPGAQWQPDTFYPTGSIVTSSSNDGHFYMAVTGGVSGQDDPKLVATPLTTVKDGTVTWVDSGNAAPANAKPAPWKPNNKYNFGDVIADPYNGHFYTVVQEGTSGPPPPAPLLQPNFPIGHVTPVPEQPRPATVVDNTIEWQDTGTTPPAGKNPSTWVPNKSYNKGDVIVNPTNGHYYTVLNAVGTSGTVQPDFPVTTTLTVTWQDIGITVPAPVTGGQPADQTVSLLNLTLPQSHSLARYNLATGIVASSIRNRSFGIVNGKPEQTSNNLSVDPVLFFTAYIHPFDAERHYRAKDLIPGASFGLSLSSPGSSFYFGGSSEILRNVQLVYGLNWAKVTKLAPPGTAGSNTTTAPTVQSFSKGGFIGLTFNISGFIQGGGGGKSSSQ